MERGAIHVINILQAYPVSKVQERHHHILLSCQVQNIKRIISSLVFAYPMLLHEIFYYLHVPTVCCVKQRSKPFIIFFVEPFLQFLIWSENFCAGLRFPIADILLGLINEYFNKVEVSLIGKLMQHIISLWIINLNEINVGVTF